MASRTEHAARKNRESLSKRLGKTAARIKARDAHRCAYCAATAESSGAHLHLDHLTPRALGGLDVPANLVLACRRCNTARQALTLSQWAAYAAATHGLHFSPRAIRAQARRRLPEAA